MADCLRGIETGGNDMRLLPNGTNAEITNFDGLSLTPTGFKITTSNALINPNGTGVVYMAIRRPDGYCGRPPEAGTDAFAMDVGNGSSDISVPNFDSGFPVDLGIYKQTAAANDWVLSDRLISGRWLRTNGTNPEATYSGIKFDSNVGWAAGGFNTAVQSWMWKRGQGCDVVTYDGLSGAQGQHIPHSLGRPAEMIFIKRMDGSEEWAVGADAMTDWNKYMKLNTNDGELNAYGTFSSTAPTATHFSLSQSSRANYTGYRYVAMLFASVTGISKCGSYDGSNSTITVTTGFQPRFIIIKRTNSGGSWLTWDTVRGWVDGNNNKSLAFNSASRDTTANGYTGGPISTGFTLNSNADYNGNGGTYLYYAHA